MVYCTDFHYVELSLHSRTKYHLVRLHKPFSVLLNSVYSILLRIFVPMLVRNIGLLDMGLKGYSFPGVSLSGFRISVLASNNEL